MQQGNDVGGLPACEYDGNVECIKVMDEFN